MKIITEVVNAIGYITEGSLEIFSPNHDSYPATGIQPYSGEAYYSYGKHHGKSHRKYYSKPVAKVS